MKFTVEAAVERVADPSTPIVWLDPSLPEEVWAQLPPALERRGFRVLEVDASGPIQTLPQLVHRLAQMAGLASGANPSPDLYRTLLASLGSKNPPGSVLLWRDPSFVRQQSESGFEDFIDSLELLHETGTGELTVAPKLVLLD
jgi:hypothetical protein